MYTFTHSSLSFVAPSLFYSLCASSFLHLPLSTTRATTFYQIPLLPLPNRPLNQLLPSLVPKPLHFQNYHYVQFFDPASTRPRRAALLSQARHHRRQLHHNALDKYADVLTHVKAAFRTYNLEDIRLCDVNGEPLYDDDKCLSYFGKVVHGEHLPIAIGNERIRPEPELEVELYLEIPGLGKSFRVSTPTTLKVSWPIYQRYHLHVSIA
jgi:hypothetical protein